MLWVTAFVERTFVQSKSTAKRSLKQRHSPMEEVEHLTTRYTTPTWSREMSCSIPAWTHYMWAIVDDSGTTIDTITLRTGANNGGDDDNSSSSFPIVIVAVVCACALLIVIVLIVTRRNKKANNGPERIGVVAFDNPMYVHFGCRHAPLFNMGEGHCQRYASVWRTH